MGGLSQSKRLLKSASVSPAELLASLPDWARQEMIAGLAATEIEALEHDWRFWARPKQLPPPGDWNVWVVRAGRGFGKTRLGSGWVHERAREVAERWVALVAKTP